MSTMTRNQALDIIEEINAGGRVAAAIARKAYAIAGERANSKRGKATDWRKERHATMADKRQFMNSRA